MNSDSQIHLGHRERMRRKLVAYGAEIFDTYELLEMLLYSVVPVRDTNPIAKMLLRELGDLDGVLSATFDGLTSVTGVGAATANYLATVGALPMLMPASLQSATTLENYDEIGSYLVRYCENKDKYAVSVLLLDNAMRPIKVADVYNCDYGKGSVHCKPFLDLAMTFGAACVVIFHNHPYGPLYPSHADILTHKILAEGFKHSGVTLLDHFLVSGRGYIRIGKMATEANGVDKLYSDYGIVCIKSGVSPKDIGNDDPHNCARAYIESIMSYTVSDEEKRKKYASSLLARYHRLDNILSRDYEELEEICGSAAIGLKLLAYVTSRRYTDSVRAGKKIGEWVSEYFKWYYFGASAESVLLALFDKDGRFITTSKISEGTVSGSDIIPRKAMEAVTKAKAAFAVMAHNHPGGTCEVSRQDVHATAVVAKVLSDIGVKLLDHVVVAGMNVGEVEILDEIPDEV